MTCCRNLFKHLKHWYQIKTNREMLQHDFQFFVNLMSFSFLKKWSNISFSFYFSHLSKFSNQKKMWRFSITLSHFEEFHEFLYMMGAITISGKNSFIFNFVGYELVTKSLGGLVHIWGGGRENKMSKYGCELFPTKLEWIISPSF